MKLPKRQHDLAARIYAAIKDNTDIRPRPHLGASQIGHKCRRWLWLSFRWCIQEDFDGRMLRLFRRGQEEEKYLVADMRAAGMTIDAEENGRQHRVELLPHFSGSMDGIILDGVPDGHGKKHIFEAKTSGKKAFDDLLKNGVKESKPLHYAQMQIYMLGSEIDRALYVVVCKDDDRIYSERVRFDVDEAMKLKLKAEQIIFTDRLPEPLSTNPSWYECKFCAAYSFCHQKDKSKIMQNCRSCAYSSATDEGFRCHKFNDLIPLEHQRVGCGDYEMNEDLEHETA